MRQVFLSFRFVRQEGFTTGRGGRDGIPDIIVILTDGNSNVQSQRTLEEAYQAKAQGIHIISMGKFRFSHVKLRILRLSWFMIVRT